MLQVAIVEDDPQDMARLVRCVQTYAKQEKLELSLRTFSDGADLIEMEQAAFNIVFLDIEMAHMNGIETARALRRRDLSVCIIFVTNITKYAIQSYEVDALDYVLKPVKYALFEQKMRKALHYVELHQEKCLWIADKDGMIRIPASEIRYIEKEKNYLMFNTDSGIYRERGTMTELEEKLAGNGFAKISSGCMVNLMQVTSIGRDTVKVRDMELPVSRQLRKGFQEKLIGYIRDGVSS